MQLAQNAVVLSVDAQDLVKLARDTSITRVVPVANYSLDLSETVPYIGGETAHELGAKGKGVRIAVIDSGVDYTHAALFGPGTVGAEDQVLRGGGWGGGEEEEEGEERDQCPLSRFAGER